MNLYRTYDYIIKKEDFFEFLDFIFYKTQACIREIATHSLEREEARVSIVNLGHTKWNIKIDDYLRKKGYDV